uniref:Putative cytochrome n=1 Tax=Nyssomyia neivai TaxID=330878 RepID=A0A1L8E476_9DIPT
MLFTVLLLVAIIAIIYYVYQVGTKNENFFVERGLKFKKPTFLVGNYLPIFLRKTSLFEYLKNIHNDFPNEKIIGHFDFRKPIIVILDPEIAKQVSVKDFENFVDHQEIFNEETDPDFGNSLFALKGQKWKDMRATLSPAFTGSKMRLMCDFIVEICGQMVDFLKIEAAEKGPQIHDAKQLLSRLTMDVIGTCAFGVKVDSLKNMENDFFVTAKKIANFTSVGFQLKFILFKLCPSLMVFLKTPLFQKEGKEYLKNIVLNTMKTREDKNITRPDMIHLLMEAQKGNLVHSVAEKDTAGFATVEESTIGLTSSKRNWTDTEIVAQCFIFFIAGFEGVSIVSSFMLYEIMVNTDIQDKLFAEISEANKKLDGKPLKYDTLKQLKYLDMVTSEFLRKWSGPFFDRCLFT